MNTIKTTLTIVILSLSVLAKSNPFTIETGLSYSVGYINPKMKGVGIIFEPKLSPSPYFNFGTRFELDLLFGQGASKTTLSVGMLVSGSTLVKGEVLFYRKRSSPFIGLSAGGYFIGGGSGGVSILHTVHKSITAGYFFGFMPQVGYDFGRLRLSLGCNIIYGKQNVEITVKEDVLHKEIEDITIPILSFEITGTLFK